MQTCKVTNIRCNCPQMQGIKKLITINNVFTLIIHLFCFTLVVPDGIKLEIPSVVVSSKLDALG